MGKTWLLLMGSALSMLLVVAPASGQWSSGPAGPREAIRPRSSRVRLEALEATSLRRTRLTGTITWTTCNVKAATTQ